MSMGLAAQAQGLGQGLGQGMGGQGLGQGMGGQGMGGQGMGPGGSLQQLRGSGLVNNQLLTSSTFNPSLSPSLGPYNDNNINQFNALHLQSLGGGGGGGQGGIGGMLGSAYDNNNFNNLNNNPGNLAMMRGLGVAQGQGLGMGLGQMPGGPLGIASGLSIPAGMGMSPYNTANKDGLTVPGGGAGGGVTLGEILCPSDKVSLVIGAKGSIINEISRKTAAVISVIDEDQNNGRMMTSSLTYNPTTHRLIVV